MVIVLIVVDLFLDMLDLLLYLLLYLVRQIYRVNRFEVLNVPSIQPKDSRD